MVLKNVVILAMIQFAFIQCVCAQQSDEQSMNKDSLSSLLVQYTWHHLTPGLDYKKEDTLYLRMNMECLQTTEFIEKNKLRLVFKSKKATFTEFVWSNLSYIERKYLSESNVYRFKLKERGGHFFILMKHPYFSDKMIWHVGDIVMDDHCRTRPQISLTLIKVNSYKMVDND